MPSKYPSDLTGIKFGMLTPVKKIKDIERYRSLWLCKCDCGNEVAVRNDNLCYNHTKSCGCLQKRKTSESNKTHGMTKTRLYRTWYHMKERCQNENDPRYSNYGGRGITVCKDWMDFEPFAEWAYSNGYNDTLTIERIDVNGNYCPENCTWIPSSKQANNKQSSHFFTIDGITKTMTEWAKIYGIKPTTVFNRLSDGWDEYSAITKPLRGTKA